MDGPLLLFLVAVLEHADAAAATLLLHLPRLKLNLDIAEVLGGKAVLLAGVTDDLVKKGLKAGDVIKEIAPIVGGGGGGRPQMAQAGGKKPEKINDALAKAKKLIKEKLAD